MATPPRREYELTVRQEPKQARMCGVGGKHNLQFHHLGNITLLIQPTVAQSTLLQSSSCASLIPARADRLPVHLQQVRIMRPMGEVCFSLSILWRAAAFFVNVDCCCRYLLAYERCSACYLPTRLASERILIKNNTKKSNAHYFI
jgi:hypothetical protein